VQHVGDMLSAHGASSDPPSSSSSAGLAQAQVFAGQQHDRLGPVPTHAADGALLSLVTEPRHRLLDT
jgi:hypothetical protein